MTVQRQWRRILLVLLVLSGIGVGVPASAAAPRVLDDRLTLQLVAHEPDIVTPIGMTFDQKGRLLVIESHTHFPKDDYAGPKHDRIRILEDTDGDGAADRFRSFYEGSEKTMSLATGPEGWIYVATRMRIFRVRDTNGDDQADEEQEIAHLETAGNYPHNGLCGLCLDGKGALYFGLGENLGADYTLIGSDGRRLSGGGEGGNIYHCEINGQNLSRVATGFWNPFGICLDSSGRLFTVGNDPDASPPCRLVQIVPGADYGYQFRYGRSGKHPLQAWDGELPGTLPMVAGTSEAPSDVIAFRGQLWVTSWGEYRIERFSLKPRGASWRADREVVVEGDDQFRPVDFTVAPDSSLYFSDWVDRSYNVHGKGRVWRLSWKSAVPKGDLPPLSDDERLAAKLAGRTGTQAELLAALSSSDPFLHQAAVTGLTDSVLVAEATLNSFETAGQRQGVLEAARRSHIEDVRISELLQSALRDSDANVRLYAVRWIADERLRAFRPALDSLLSDEVNSVALFRAVLAARDWLDTGKVERNPLAGEPELVAALNDPSRPESIRAMALQVLPANHPSLSAQRLFELAISAASGAAVRREAVRSLALATSSESVSRLEALASDAELPGGLRADALAGLNPADSGQRTTLDQLANAEVPDVRAESRRVIARAGAVLQTGYPAVADTAAWLGSADDRAAASPASGWRVFFGQHAARCANCHRLSGRGADVGPDLTGIARRMSPERVVQSILEPSREIAPHYVAWLVELKSGRTFSGVSLGVPGSGTTEEFLDNNGKKLTVQRDEIETRSLSKLSIMPDNLHQRLTVSELRDLLALLAQP